MSRMFLVAPLFAAAMLGVAPTGAVQAAPDPSAKPPQQCFSASRIANWAKVDDGTVNLRVEGGAYFQLVLTGQCLKAARSPNAALSFETRTSDDVCRPLDVTVVVATGIAPLRCSVESLRRLSPEEVAALPSKLKP